MTKEDIEALRKRGVRHVITVNSMGKDHNIAVPLSEAKIAYTFVEVKDFQSPTAKDFKYIYEEFKKHDRNAHIWCGFGDGRSGTVVSAIQMYTQKEFSGNPEMLSEDVWIKVWARNKVEKPIQMEALGMLFDEFHPPSGSRGKTVAIIRKINPFYTVSDARKKKYIDALPKSVENISFCKRASKCMDLADMAEKLSERRFAQLAGEHGVARVAQEKWSMTLSDVRKKFGYQQLTGESIKLKLPSLSKLGKNLGKGLLDPLWVVDVVHAFTTDASTIDRWEAVTSILPFVGCGWEARADAKKGDTDLFDTFTCLAADALLLTPLWPVGLILSVARALKRAFEEPPHLPTQEEVVAQRDKPWNNLLIGPDHSLYAYIYSNLRYSGPAPSYNGTFAEKLNGSLAAETLSVLSYGSQLLGMAEAVAQDEGEIGGNEPSDGKLNDDKSDGNKDRKTVEKVTGGERNRRTLDKIDGDNNSNSGPAVTTANLIAEVEAAMSKEILRRHRQVLIDVPKKLKSVSDDQLGDLSTKYNDEFIMKLNSEKMVQKYKKITYGLPKVGDATDDSNQVRADLNKLASHLKQNKPALPSLFTLAHVLGQSKGVGRLQPAVLDLHGYLKSAMPGLNDIALNQILVFHAVQVARVLRGEIREEELPDSFPTASSSSKALSPSSHSSSSDNAAGQLGQKGGDPANARDFQILIAIRFGRVYDDWKAKNAAEISATFPWAPPGKEIDRLTRPQLPSQTEHVDVLGHLTIITGLSSIETNIVAMLEKLQEDPQKYTQLLKPISDSINKICKPLAQECKKWNLSQRN